MQSLKLNGAFSTLTRLKSKQMKNPEKNLKAPKILVTKTPGLQLEFVNSLRSIKVKISRFGT